jgi:hypothetical protein
MYNKIMTDEVKFAAIQFAQACVDQNSVSDLRASISRPDVTDMETWNLTQSEYLWALNAAIYAIENDTAIMDDGRVPV